MLQLVPLLAATVDHCPSGGVRVDHVCWQLSLPGQSCLDLCAGMVDRPLTINGASDTKVVHALDRGYGLGASYFDDLDQPCHTSWIKQVRQLHAWRLGESANLPSTPVDPLRVRARARAVAIHRRRCDRVLVRRWRQPRRPRPLALLRRTDDRTYLFVRSNSMCLQPVAAIAATALASQATTATAALTTAAASTATAARPPSLSAHATLAAALAALTAGSAQTTALTARSSSASALTAQTAAAALSRAVAAAAARLAAALALALPDPAAALRSVQRRHRPRLVLAAG